MYEQARDAYWQHVSTCEECHMNRYCVEIVGEVTQQNTGRVGQTHNDTVWLLCSRGKELIKAIEEMI